MHNYHSNNFYFHANGDPIPSDVLIQAVAGMDPPTFRTTSEEVLTFWFAHKMEATKNWLELRTTSFSVSDGIVWMRNITTDRPDYQKDDADLIQVPMADLDDFIRQIIGRHVAYKMEEADLDIGPALGLLLALKAT